MGSPQRKKGEKIECWDLFHKVECEATKGRLILFPKLLVLYHNVCDKIFVSELELYLINTK